MKTSLKSLFVGIFLSAMPAHAVVYTWSGLAADGDWANAGNWDGNGVPVDFQGGSAGLEFETSTSDRIVINSSLANSPATNVPALYALNGTSATPAIDVLNGSVTFDISSSISGEVVLVGAYTSTIGDGNAGNGTATLTYNTNSWFHRTGGTMATTINSDGALVFNDPTFSLSYNTDRIYEATLAGGSITILGEVTDILRNDPGVGSNWFDFTQAGASFTADFGGDLADLATVNGYIGAANLFRSSTALTLQATDNMDGSFTVTTIPEPSAALLGGMGVLLLLRRRR